MTKIMRIGGVKLSDDVVKISDVCANIKPKPRAVVHSVTENDAVLVGAELPEHMNAPPKVSAEERSEADTAVQLGGGIKEEIIQGAMQQAGHILEEAVGKAQKVREEQIASAQAEINILRHKAEDEGKAEGRRQVLGDVAKATNELEDAVVRYEGARAGFEAEYEEQLKWLAMEIASKVLAKKIHDDDAEMTEMVQKAVQGVKSEPWVRIEVAEEMTRLLASLSDVYAGQENIEISAVPTAAGSVHIETPSGVIDASLATQLENLRHYFAKDNT